MNFPAWAYIVAGSLLVVTAFYLLERHIWLFRLAQAHSQPESVRRRSPLIFGVVAILLAAGLLFMGYYDGNTRQMVLVQVITMLVSGAAAAGLFVRNSARLRRQLNQ